MSVITRRGYQFVCLCGRHVNGDYPIPPVDLSKPLDELPPIDPKRAICIRLRGAAKGQLHSVKETHDVGCGRTLADLDAHLADQRETLKVQA